MIRRHKYGAKPATDRTGTRSFQSQLERDRYEELHLLELAGGIRGLVTQPRVELLPGIGMRPDFAYEEGGRLVFDEAKGVETAVWRLQCRLWAHFGPGVLRVVKRQGRGTVVVKEIAGSGQPTQDVRLASPCAGSSRRTKS